MKNNSIELARNTIFAWKKQLDAVSSNVGYDSVKFMASAALAFQGNEDLIAVLNTPEGQASALQELKCAASLGINLNPAEQLGCLVPRAGKIKFQIQKNGLLMLAKESGEINAPVVDLVREKDFFEITKSSNGDEYSHKPALKERGEIIGFYASMTFKDTKQTVVKYMSIDEMIEHKNKYSSAYLTDEKGNLKANAAWNKSFAGMGMKTVLKYLLRSFSISRSLTVAITHDDKFESGEDYESEIINVTPKENKAASSNDALKKMNENKKNKSKKTEVIKEEKEIDEELEPGSDIESDEEGDIL